MPLLLRVTESPTQHSSATLETTYSQALDYSITNFDGRLVASALVILARTHTFTNATSDQGGGDTD